MSDTDRPVVLCLAGTMTPPAVFSPLVPLVEADLLLLDWMGTPGPWDVDHLAEWVVGRAQKQAAGRRVLLAGHSTGGLIALAVAVRAAGSFTGMLLASTGASMRGHGDVDALLDRVRHDWGEPFADDMAARSCHVPLPPALQAEVTRYARASKQAVVLEVLSSQRATNLEQQLDAVSIPVTVVHGRHDRARPLPHAQRLVRGLPRAELVVLDTGHTPMAEDPGGCAHALQSLAARSTGQ